jgi:hypothetical protein
MNVSIALFLKSAKWKNTKLYIIPNTIFHGWEKIQWENAKDAKSSANDETYSLKIARIVCVNVWEFGREVEVGTDELWSNK